MRQFIAFLSEYWFPILAMAEFVLTLLWFPALWHFSIPIATTAADLSNQPRLDVAMLQAANKAIGADLVFKQIGPEEIAFRTRFRLFRHQSTPVVRGLLTTSQLSPTVRISSRLYWFIPAVFAFLIAYARGVTLLVSLLAITAILLWNLRLELRVHRQLQAQLSKQQPAQQSSFGA